MYTVGELAGKFAFKPVMEVQKKRATAMETHVLGEEHLLEVPKDQCVLFAGNYPGPVEYYGKDIPGIKGNIRFASGFVPSSFVMLSQIERTRQKRVAPIMAAALDHYEADGTLTPSNRLRTNLMMEAISAMGGIPVDKSSDRFGKANETFLRRLAQVVHSQEKPDLLIFPEGHWRKKNEKLSEDTFKPEIGTAHIAIRHKLPIVPFYVYCPEGWDAKAEKQEVFVIYGKPIDPTMEIPAGKERKAYLTELLAKRVVALQEELKVSCEGVEFPF